ncbi:MAG TPA: hypothetical protein DCF68_02015 [Cyanothece sp. UBA12306]|nr:hypothetical protein [Cyanothece sp. UBA12306]
MRSPKQSSSSFRYFVAGLKPFGSLVFLAPIGIISIVALTLWQYELHPEWLGTTSPPGPDLNEGLPNNLDNSINGQNSAINSPISPSNDSLSLENNDRDLPLPKSLDLDDPETPVAPRNLSELTPLSESNNQNNNVSKRKLPQLFQPLLPYNKNPNSLFPPLSTPNNSNQAETIPNLKPVEIAPVQENQLNKAMERVYSENSSNSTINSAPSSINNSSPTSSNPINQVPTQTQSPYQAYPGNPNAYVAPPVQQTQPGYGNPNVYPIQPVQPISPYGQNSPQGYNQPNGQPQQPNYGMQRPQVPGYGR